MESDSHTSSWSNSDKGFLRYLEVGTLSATRRSTCVLYLRTFYLTVSAAVTTISRSAFTQGHRVWRTYATGTLLLSVTGTFVRLRVLPDLPGMPISLISRLIFGTELPKAWTNLGRLPNPASVRQSGGCFRFRGRGEPLGCEGYLRSFFVLIVVLVGNLLSSCDRLPLRFISWCSDPRSPMVEQTGSFRFGLASGIIGETGEAGYILVLGYFNLTSSLWFFAIVQNLWERLPMRIKGKPEK